MSRIIEILLYKLKPSTGGEFFEIMQNISVPLHQKGGIDVIWHGQSMHDIDGYGLIRAFENYDDMESVLAKFYASDDWRNSPREDIIARIDTATKIVIPMNEVAIEAMRKQGYFKNS